MMPCRCAGVMPQRSAVRRNRRGWPYVSKPEQQAKKNPPSYEDGRFGIRPVAVTLLRVARCARRGVFLKFAPKKNPPSYEDGCFGIRPLAVTYSCMA